MEADPPLPWTTTDPTVRSSYKVFAHVGLLGTDVRLDILGNPGFIVKFQNGVAAVLDVGAPPGAPTRRCQSGAGNGKASDVGDDGC